MVVAVAVPVTVKLVEVPRQRTLQSFIQHQMVNPESTAVAVEVALVVLVSVVVRQAIKRLAEEVVELAFAAWVEQPDHRLQRLEQ